MAEKGKLRKDLLEAHPDEEYRKELGMYAVGMVMKHRRYHYHCVSFRTSDCQLQGTVEICKMEHHLKMSQSTNST